MPQDVSHWNECFKGTSNDEITSFFSLWQGFYQVRERKVLTDCSELGHTRWLSLWTSLYGKFLVHVGPGWRGMWLKTEITWKPSFCTGYRRCNKRQNWAASVHWGANIKRGVKTEESGPAFSEAYLSSLGWEIKTWNVKIKSLLVTKPVHIGFSWKYHRSSFSCNRSASPILYAALCENNSWNLSKTSQGV